MTGAPSTAFAEWVRAHQGVPADQLAAQAFTDPDMLLPVITNAIEHVRRNDVHAVEEAFSVALLAQFGAQATALPPAGVLRLLPELFALGDGSHISWGQATIEQHRTRISLLQRQRDGIDETIRRHEQAIHALEQRGVRCLDDLFAAVVVP